VGAVKPGLAHWKPDNRLPLPSEAVGELLRRQAERFGGRPALHMIDPVSAELASLTYRELLEQAESCARWLVIRSQPSDRIAIWSRNAVEAVILQHGCALAGTILVHLNTAWTDPEVEHALALTRPRMAFVGKDHAGRDLEGRLAHIATCPVLPLSEISCIAREKSDRPLPKVTQESPCLIQFTSGTTGKAKGALLSHRAALLGGWLRPHCEGANENDIWLNAVPFHHIGGSCAVVLGALGVGGSFVVLERYDRNQLINLMPRVRATRMGGVPTMWHDILASPDLPNTVKLNSVSLGGATVPPELVRSIYDRLGARCGIGYGQSEFPIITAVMPNDPPDVVSDTVGRPLPHVEMKIVDPVSGATVQYGRVGEIWLRGPICMDGYWDNPKATAETIDSEGFLHTGDMGVMDADGYCRIKGRLREVIIRGGENIYPAEIESALLAHPAVALAAVVGVDDRRLGQEVAAFITLRPGATPGVAELEGHVRKFVASFKIPKTWRFVESMPLTASGKVRKVELEAMLSSHDSQPTGKTIDLI
jgi:fatty-acyl-CoA synthase